MHFALTAGQRAKSLVGYIRVQSDKVGTTLNSSALICYLVQSGLMYVSVSVWLWLVENSMTLVGFLPFLLKI